MTDDIRWKQRFDNFNKALNQLTKFIVKGELNELEQQGLIQSFEYTYELAWNVLKDYLEYQGESNIVGSRDAFRVAFRRELIENGETWMDMIRSRALTSHTYNESVAEEVGRSITLKYYPEFMALRSTLEQVGRT